MILMTQIKLRRPRAIRHFAVLFMVLFLLSGRSAKPQAAGSSPLHGQWIAAEADTAKGEMAGSAKPMPVFRKTFAVKNHLRRATLLISGLGHFEAHINGKNVSEDLLAPGWTDYRKRVFFATYDVSTLVKRGGNAIGVLLGNGMYNVQETKGRYTKFSGSLGQPMLIATLRLAYANGEDEEVVTDATWKSHAGPVIFSSTYGGEDFDATREQPGWDSAPSDFDDHAWKPAVPVTGPSGVMLPEPEPHVRAGVHHEAIEVTHPGAGVAVYDLGANLAGWPEIEVRGPAGSSVKLLGGELLDGKGFVTQRSMHAFPDSQDSFQYTLRGGEASELWHPRFSYSGFRYVQVTQAGRGVADVEHVRGVELHDDVTVRGTFFSSDPQLNGIHRIIDRAIESNLFSTITDCPHREKLGWLEQTHLAGTALMYNFDLQALYAKISDDMQDSQLDSGLVPSIAPEYPVFEGAFRDSPEWGSAVVLSPWTAYQMYGDDASLRAHYPSMKRYAAYLHSKLQDGLLSFGLGDWYDIGPGDPGPSKLTSLGFTGTATYFELLRDLAAIARLSGAPEDGKAYESEAEQIKEAFNRQYLNPEINQYDKGSQTANAMPLVVGLVPERRRQAVLQNLVKNIHQHGDHVTAGDVGFHYVVRALTDGGRSDVLLTMLMKTDAPSYGDQLAHGATTLTEAWDANPEDSQNHFMLGHAEEWFYRGLAGIDVDMSKPAGEQLRVHPAAPGALQSAGATFESKLGMVKSSWSKEGTHLRMQVTVPANTVAAFALPAGYGMLTTESKDGTAASQSSDASTLRLDGGTYVLHAEATGAASGPE